MTELAQLECSRCVMTADDDAFLEITNGVCNHCKRYDTLLTARIAPKADREQQLNNLVSSISRKGQSKPYDCIIGVSGGVDSTYVALKVKELGLRPLAVHVDNGWNSELAVSNIEKALNKLNIDLQTVVLDLREFYDIQRAFLLASTPDIEIPTDHAIQAALWQSAYDHKVKYIISGMNFATEAISVPSWSYGHSDWRYIKDVHRKYGKHPLKTYPHYSLKKLLWINGIRRVRIVSILNYMNYDRAQATQELSDRLDWLPYEGKHFESIYTRWAQGYLLPRKFGIDKRRGHLSDLINSGQLTRHEALTQLAVDYYPEQLLKSDEQLLKKKLRINDEDLNAIVLREPATYRAFQNSYHIVQTMRKAVNILRQYGYYPR